MGIWETYFFNTSSSYQEFLVNTTFTCIGVAFAVAILVSFIYIKFFSEKIPKNFVRIFNLSLLIITALIALCITNFVFRSIVLCVIQVVGYDTMISCIINRINLIDLIRTQKISR